MKHVEESAPKPGGIYVGTSRRNFLKYTGAGIITTGLILAGCDDDVDPPTGGSGNAPSVNLGSGDIGVLNYAYALEQLEAAFYTAVMSGGYYTSNSTSSDEKRIMEDLMMHEVAHREFFKAAINGASSGAAIADLTVDWGNLDFDNRSEVLATAKIFENLGVGAYNGAGQLISNADYLLIAGKIVSVEARHAAIISNLINPGTTAFTDVVDANGLDQALSPMQVLTAASKYVVNEINFSGLPTAS